MQNFLVDYIHQVSHSGKNQFFRISKHYHKKDYNYLLGEGTVELNSVGLDYSIDHLFHSFSFHYSNIFYADDMENGSVETQFDSANLSYSYKRWKKIKPFIRLSYNSYLLGEEELNEGGNSFYDVQLGCTFNYTFSENFKHEVELASKRDYIFNDKHTI